MTAHSREMDPKGCTCALLFAATLWMPMLALEVLGTAPPSRIVASPSLQRAFGLSIVAYTCIVVAVSVGSSIPGQIEAALHRAPRIADWRLTLGGAGMISIFFVTLHHPGRSILSGIGLPPEAIALIHLMLASCIVAALAVPLSVLARTAARPLLLLAWAWLPTGGWVYLLWTRFSRVNAAVSLAVLATTVGAIAIAAWSANGSGDHRPARRHATAWILGIVAPLMLCVALDPAFRPAQPAEAAPPGATNVVLVVVDTIRQDRSYRERATPLAPLILDTDTRPHATYFTQATAAGAATIPSVKSLLTGNPPSFYGSRRKLNSPPPRSAVTMPVVFRAAGYRTAGFSANGLIRGAGFSRGFDEFWSMSGWKYFADSNVLRLLWGFAGHGRVEQLGFYKDAGAVVRRNVRRWLERYGSLPFLLYVHLMDPHWPYEEHGFRLIDDDVRAVEPYSFRSLMSQADSGRGVAIRRDPRYREMVGRYDEEIRYVDAEVARIYDALKEIGLAERTVVVIVGDHGEEFFEHDGFYHGHDVYEELVHVPFIVLWPQRPEFQGLPARIDAPVSLMDVFPTLVDLLDLPQPAAPMIGRSLRPLLEGHRNARRGPIVSESYIRGRYRAAYREASLKVRLAEDGKRRAFLVYDLSVDPHETVPLPSDDPRVSPIILRATARFRSIRALGRRTHEQATLVPEPAVAGWLPAAFVR